MSVCASSIVAQTKLNPPPTSRDLLNWTLDSGRSLSEDQAKRLESELLDEPSNLDTRILLIGYYFTSSTAYDERKYVPHALWIIENAPEHLIAGDDVYMDVGYPYHASYAEAKALWKKHIAEQPTNTKILANAAVFFAKMESDLAEKYLLQARGVEPDNPKWPIRLAELYMPYDRSQEGCAKALRSYEEALLKLHGLARYLALKDVARAALCANELPKAREYARELLRAASEQDTWRNFAVARHEGNLVLGGIALREGDMPAAEKYLIRAGKTLGGQGFSLRGPNMQLALKLLEAGRHAVVLEYFALCKKFWKNPKLDTWTNDVEQGRTPSFGFSVWH